MSEFIWWFGAVTLVAYGIIGFLWVTTLTVDHLISQNKDLADALFSFYREKLRRKNPEVKGG